MFALWYFSLAFDELRKHFKFIDNIFVFFNGNDSVLVTSNQPPAIVSKESLNETDEKVPEISEIVSEEQEKESEPEPPVENLAVAEEPKLDEVIEIDDVKSDEDSNPEKIVAFPANNDDSFMFVENQKSKRSTRDTTADFLKSETNKLAENFPSVDSVVEEAKELPAVIDPVSPTKKIEESFIIIDEREKSVETPKEDQKLAEGSQTIETKLDDVVEPMKSTKIDDSFLLVDDQDSKKKSVNVKDATVGFLSAESGKPQTNGISKDTIKTIENIVGKQEFSNESDSIPSDETIGEEAMLENENKLNESIESENSKFDEGVEMKEDDEIDTKLDEKSEQPKSILEIDEEKIAAFIARADDSFLIVDDKKPKKAINIKEKTTDFLQSEIKPMATSVLPSPRNKADTMVDAAVMEKMEAGFAKLAASDSKSLLKKYLTREVFDLLKDKKTSFGSTLLDCVQSGFENHDSGVGIYAPDAEAYSLFSPIFDPIIEDYHSGFKKTDKHPACDLGDPTVFGNLDPTGEFVISTRVRCGRSMQGYPFNPCLTEAQYKEMEDKVSSTLSGLDGELKGKFYPLTGMEKTVQQQLIDDHFLFKEGDRFLQAANACRYWPTGRGIYHNDNKTFLVWCNEEDHLRIISMQMGGDLGQVYRRLVTAINEIEKRVPFSHHDRLGFLTFCPTNLGTTIRASVHIKVPKLAADYAKLEAVAGKYNLQVRGTRGEHTEAEGGVYDISNKRRMGLTEFEAVKEMYDGIAEIIKMEKAA